MDNQQKAKIMTDTVGKFLALVGKRLPDDVIQKLEELKSKEETEMSNLIYDTMFKNQQLALELNRPACQDTGLIMFFVKAGANFPLLSEVTDILKESVKVATVNAPLRHNAVEPFEEKNTGTNTGTLAPWIEWEIVPNRNDIEIEAYMAGGGCSLPGAAKVLMPSEGYEGVVKFVFDVITSYGINACPPLLVGVGIGTSVETAAMLSKKALFRPIGSRHPNEKAAEMELLLEDGLNRLGIGPQGLSGKNSVMGVHIESGARHPSTIGVGVSTGCWSHRRGTIRISEDMSYEIISHKGEEL